MVDQLGFACDCIGWFKLNTDGSSIQHRGLAGGGGLIRDAFENWVIGFSSRFDFASSIIAELSALRHGLVMAKNIGVVELDAKIAVNLVTNMSKTKKSMKSIVMECKNLLQNFEEYIVQRTYREGNRVANVLARWGVIKLRHLLFIIIMLLLNPNPQINFLFALDNMNVLTTHDVKS